MFFKFIRVIVRVLLAIINGNAQLHFGRSSPNMVGPVLYGAWCITKAIQLLG